MKILVSDLIPGTNYDLQFRTDDGEAVSEWSAVYSITTIAQTDNPEPPTGVTWAVVNTSNTYLGQWNDVTTTINGNPFKNFAYYEVVIDDNDGTSFSFMTNELKFPFSRSDQIAAFGEPKAQLGFKVRTVDTAGSASAYTSRILSGKPAPAAPTGLTAESRVGGVVLDWTEVDELDIAGYRVYASTSSSFTPGPTNLKATVQGGSYNFTTATYTTWYFKVSAIDSFGQESTFASVSSSVGTPFEIDALAPKVPTGLAGTIVTDDTTSELRTVANLTWTAVTLNADNSPITDLAGYRIRYGRTGFSGESTVTVSPEDTSTQIANLRPYAGYWFDIEAFDFMGNESGRSADITPTPASNTAPSTPAAPSAASSTMQVQVTVSGLKSGGGSMEVDVDHYRVYGSTTTGFTPAAANMLGTIPTSPAMIGTFNLPASGGGATQNWYIKIVAVDGGGLASSASAQVTATPGLIDTANIVDASITNAKIDTLAANKLTAGTGLITDLTVKSTLTIGDATTDGAVESYGYVAGVSGYALTKSGLEVNDGNISANAIRLQNAPNILRPDYADFEYRPEYYNNFFSPQVENDRFVAYGLTYETENVKYNNHAMRVKSFVPGCLLPDGIGYSLEPDTEYIFSFWAKDQNSMDTNVRICADWGLGDDLVELSNEPLLATGTPTWRRYYTTFTTPAAAAMGERVRIGVGFEYTDTSYMQNLASYPEPFALDIDTDYAGVELNFIIDGLQLEPKVSASDIPSEWKPPATTVIDGAGITTGTVRSTSTYGETDEPSWFIDNEGDAAFSNLLIRGTTIIGQYRDSDPDADDLSVIQSYNFEPNVIGWRLRSDGPAELMDATVSGDLMMEVGTIGKRLITGGYDEGSGLERSQIIVDEKGKMVLQSGIQPPPVAPMYEPYWKDEVATTIPSDMTGIGICRDGTDWYCATNDGKILLFNGSTWTTVKSNINAGVASKWNITASGGIVKRGFRYYVGGYLPNLGGAIAYAVLDSTFNRIGTRFHVVQAKDIIGTPTIGSWDSDTLVMSYAMKSDNKVYFVVMDDQPAGLHDVMSTTKWFRSAWRPGNGVNAVQRIPSEDKVMVWLAGTGEKCVSFENVANAQQASTTGHHNYLGADGWAVRALFIDGSDNFFTMGNAGRISAYSTETTRIIYIRYQFEATSPSLLGTGLSPTREITTEAGTWPRFSHNVSYPSAASKASFFASSTSTETLANWKLQAEASVGSNTVASPNIFNTLSGRSPYPDKFVITTGGLIQSSSSVTAETFELKGDGTGVWPLKFRLYEGVVPISAVNTPNSVNVVFDPPFKHTPVVVAGANVNSVTAGVSVGGRSTTGCTVYGVRYTGTANINFSLIAGEADADYTRSGE